MSADISRIHLLLERGRPKEAEGLLHESLAKWPDQSELHLLHSRALRDLGRPKESEEAARRAIGLDPEWGVPHEALAMAMIESGKWNEAEAAIKEAQAIDGDDADRRAILARIYSERNKNAIALEHAQAGLEIDPDHDACRFFQGVLLARLGRHEEADHTAAGLLADDPDASYNHSARGWILLERNAYAEAKMHFLEALRLEPENEDARMGLARSLQHQSPVLGWFLRLIIRVDRVPMHWMIAAIALVIFVFPKLLEGPGKPPALHIVNQVLQVGLGLFFYSALAARPLFDGLLACSKEGRMALTRREMQAVAWCTLPLLAGVALTVMWLFKGAKNLPYQGIVMISLAVVLHEAFTCRHPWVRRRLLAFSAAIGALALWIAAGPFFILDPMRDGIIAKLPEYMRAGIAARTISASELPAEFRAEFGKFLQFRNWAFIYPALLVYFAAAYADNLSSALLRRAPDEDED